MQKCKDCPLLGEDTECLSGDRRWAFFCDWARSGDPAKRDHVLHRSRVGAAPEPAPHDPGSPTRGSVLVSPPRTPDIPVRNAQEPPGKEEEEMRRSEEAKLQNAIAIVSRCRYRGPEAACKCNGKRRCGKGFGFRGEVTLNNCIDCVIAGKNS